MRTFAAMLLSIVFSINAWSCDVCGCAGMIMGFGDLSLYPQNRIGISYLSRTFKSSLGSNDYFTQLDVNGRYVISSRWSVQASIPYLWGLKSSMENDPVLIHGLGDASVKVDLIAYYSGSETASRKLIFSTGVFMPTGRFEDRSGSTLPQNFQIGSASWDYLLESRYQMNKGNWVALLQGQYVINTLNREAYKFGNQTGVQLTTAYKFGFSKWALVPLTSLGWENFDRDVNSRGYYQYGTGGQGLILMAGAQVKTKNWLLSVRGGSTLFNGRGNYSPGPQMALSLNYLINNSKK
ncbi:MAG: hypothetical protein ACPF9D_06860 [Owenweeksia sp.]